MRMLLKGLEPHQVYIVQLRTVSGERKSNYSRSFELQTLKDEIAPNPVTSLSGVFNQGNLSVAWVPPTANSDGSPLNDLKDYRVTVGPFPADPILLPVEYFAESNRFAFTKEMNIARHGTYKSNLVVTVEARDLVGNLSTVSTITKVKARPAAPTSLDWRVTGNAFSGTWVPPTTNTDGTQFDDPSGYEVTVVYAVTSRKSYVVQQPKFDFSYEQNKADFGGVLGKAKGTLSLEVRAIDSIGQRGDMISMEAINPVPVAPTGLTATSQYDAVSLAWTKNTEDDLENYEVWVSTVSASDTGTIFGRPVSNFYNHDTVNWSTNHWFYVKAVDVFGGASLPSVRVGPVKPKNAINVNTTAPAIPTGLAVVPLSANNTNPVGLRVSWNAVANPENDLAGYTVRYIKSGSAVYNYVDVPPDVITTDIEGLTSATLYGVSVRSYDFTGNRLAFSSTVNATTNSEPAIVIPPKTDSLPPSTSPTPVVNPLFGALEVKWSAVTNADPVTYEVHVSGTSGFATAPATKALEVDGTFAIIKTLPGTTTSLTYGLPYYVRILAKDFDGSAAAGPQASATTLRVDNGDIAADAVRANNIFAGSVTANKLNIGVGGENNLVNSSFENPINYVSSWVNGTNAVHTKIAGRASGFAVRQTTTGYVPFYQDIAVVAGQKKTISAWVRGNGTSSGTTGLIYEWVGGASGAQEAKSANADITMASLPQNVWVRQWRTVNPSASGFIRVLSQGTYGGTMTGTFDTDDVMIEDGDILSAYRPKTDEILPGSIVGTQIKDGEVTTAHVVTTGLSASVITAGSTFTQNLNVGSQFTLGTVSGGAGEIRSFNYSGGTDGFQLTSSGLTIRSGNIAARALEIQEGSNIVPAMYAGFEFRDSAYTGQVATNTVWSIQAGGKFESQSLQATASGYVYMHSDTAQANGNIPVEPNTTYILSYYDFLVSGVATASPRVRNNVTADTGSTWAGSAAVLNTWTRRWYSFTTGATDTIAAIWFEGTGAGEYKLDGIQLERKIANSDIPSAWKPPGLTRIDGGVIRTGEIRSTANVTYDATTQPAWSLNMQGGLQVNDALVRGKLIVGTSGNQTNLATAGQTGGTLANMGIFSGNYGGSGSQWAVKGDGSIDLRTGGPTSSNVTINGSGIIGRDAVGTQRFVLNTSGQFLLQTTNGGVSFDDNGIYGYSGATNTFYINRNGSAYFNGQIQAASGSIGGWTIVSNSLSAGNLNLRSDLGMIYGGDAGARVAMRAGEGFWAGADAWANGPFRVTTGGALYSTSGRIGGFWINGESGLYGGDNSTRVQMQPGIGFWAGANSRDSAPWRVNQDGYMYASNATIYGGIVAYSGELHNLNVLGTLSGGTISGTTIVAGNYYSANSIPRVRIGPSWGSGSEIQWETNVNNVNPRISSNAAGDWLQISNAESLALSQIFVGKYGSTWFDNYASGSGAGGRTLTLNSNSVIVNGARSLEFEAITRQMINLYSNTYGIGVQASTAYIRTSHHFAIYKGGGHSEAELNGGGGLRYFYIRGDDNKTYVTGGTVLSSSQRIKKNIKSIPKGKGKETVNKLRPVNYQRTDEGFDNGNYHYGLIAEEVNEVVPEAIGWDGKDYPAGIDYTMLIPHLIASVQDLTAELSELKAQLAQKP